MLEGELKTVGGIEEIRSTATPGSASITLSFERGTDLDFATLRLEQRLAAAQGRLPEQVFLNLQRFDTSVFRSWLMQISFRGNADMTTLTQLADDVVVPALSAVDGVVQVYDLELDPTEEAPIPAHDPSVADFAAFAQSVIEGLPPRLA